MKVAIITEGFKGTGYGHLTRCLSIYQGFEEKGIIPLFIANCDEHGKAFLPKVNLIQLDWLNEQENLFNLIKDFDIAIIDSYLAPIEIYNTISNAVNKAVYFDDYIRLDYPPGIIINGAIGVEILPYEKNDKQNFLLGVDYAPLRKPFWDVVIPEKNTKKIENVFINFGGQDNKNLTAAILNYMLSEFPKLNYNVVYGSKAENTTKFENVNYYYELNADEMLDLMLKCHLAITAAGQTIYELARIGISTIAIGTADNQKYNLKGWVKMGFLEEELWIEQTDLLEKIKNHISKLKSSLSIERKVYCDGQGARRFINELLMPEIGNKFYFRKFTKDDITSIYNLSNEDEVRSFSINKSNISWETHQNWFNEKLKSNYAFYLITLTFKQELIGQIKFDIKNEMPEISISISKNFRGKGMSTHILQNACKLFFAVYPEKSEITAHIKEDNIKSIRSFEKTGFIFKGQKQINSRIFNYYILNKTTLNVN